MTNILLDNLKLKIVKNELGWILSTEYQDENYTGVFKIESLEENSRPYRFLELCPDDMINEINRGSYLVYKLTDDSLVTDRLFVDLKLTHIDENITISLYPEILSEIEQLEKNIHKLQTKIINLNNIVKPNSLFLLGIMVNYNLSDIIGIYQSFDDLKIYTQIFRK